MQNSTEHNPVNKTGNTSLLHQSGHRRDASLNNFDNLSCDDFVETLPKNQYEDILKNSNNLHFTWGTCFTYTKCAHCNAYVGDNGFFCC